MVGTGLEMAHRSRFHLPQQVSKWVDHVLGTGYHRYSPSEAWVPAINFFEDAAQYLVVVDLAGIPAEEIAREDMLRVEKGVLFLAGQRESPGREELKGPVRAHHMEIDSGRFCREIDLPGNVDVEAIEATYRNGFLWIRLPKKG